MLCGKTAGMLWVAHGLARVRAEMYLPCADGWVCLGVCSLVCADRPALLKVCSPFLRRSAGIAQSLLSLFAPIGGHCSKFAPPPRHPPLAPIGGHCSKFALLLHRSVCPVSFDFPDIPHSPLSPTKSVHRHTARDRGKLGRPEPPSVCPDRKNVEF
jgi:hypothetical protein